MNTIKYVGHYNIECLGEYYENNLCYYGFNFIKFNDKGKEINKITVYVYCSDDCKTRSFMNLFYNEETVEAFLKGVKNYERLEYDYKTRRITLFDMFHDYRLNDYRNIAY